MAQLLEKTCNHWSEDSIRLIHTPSSLARNTFFYLQEVGYFKTTPPYSTERANLSSYLLIFTLSGRGVLEVNGQKWDLVPGECMFLDCMQHHRYYARDDGVWEFLWVHFHGASSLGYYREFSRYGTATVPVGDPETFQETFWQIIHLQQEWSVASEIRINQCIVSLLTQLLLDSIRSDRDASAWPAYVKQMVNRVEHSYAESITLERLAGEFGVSKFHLSREFKRLVGMNFMEYLMRIRLSHAKELLRFSDIPVAEVSQRCGFHDVSHFIRIFKQREEGNTPLNYRRQWK